MRSCFGYPHTSNDASQLALNQIRHIYANVYDCMGCFCIYKAADCMPMACSVLMMSYTVCQQLLFPEMRYIASECVGML